MSVLMMLARLVCRYVTIGCGVFIMTVFFSVLTPEDKANTILDKYCEVFGTDRKSAENKRQSTSIASILLVYLFGWPIIIGGLILSLVKK